MKIAGISSIAFALVFASLLNVHAQTWVVYDNFDKNYIDRTKWWGDEYPTSGIPFYENVRRIESDSTFGKRLHLAIRNYGPVSDDTGTLWIQNRLSFSNPEAIKGIKAKIQAGSLKATGCSANGGKSMAYVRILGYFFNADGNAVEGDHTGDVSAQIRLQRSSDSADPEGTLTVVATAQLCLDAGCDNATIIASSSMGRASSGQTVTLSILWDQQNKRFIAPKNKKTPVYLSYDGKVASDQYAPSVNEKRFTASCVPSRCPSGAAVPYAVADAYLDNVYVQYANP